jgi:hypothetical protein
MGLLASIFTGPILSTLLDRIIGPFTDCYKAYLNKQITEIELREKLSEILITSMAETEKSHADTLAQTYQTFMASLDKSTILKTVWAATAISQLLVLLWHQVGIPAIVAVGLISHYPSSGSTVEWAYALLGACLGLGPLVLRTGPGSSNSLSGLQSILKLR